MVVNSQKSVVSLLLAGDVLYLLLSGGVLCHGLGWLLLQSRFPHGAVHLLVLLEHLQLHLRLPTHGLRRNTETPWSHTDSLVPHG